MHNNLPIKIDDKTEISIVKKRNLNRIKEQLKRIGITGIDIAVGISFGLLPWALGSTIANPAIGSIVSTIGMTTIIGATYETFINGFHKRNKDMMFVTRKKLNGEIYITQDILYDLKFLNKLKDYNAETSLGKRMKDGFRAGSNNFKKGYEVQIDESAKTPEQASRNVISQESEKTL